MASTDPSEWILLDSDLTSKLSILPAGKSHLYFELNEPGSGELSVPLDSNAASVITSGMFAQNNYRGDSRGGFFVDNIGITHVDAAEEGGRWMSISGRGAMALLEDAIVWGNGTSETTREFAAASQASILITLLTEAQARGGLAALTWDFSASVDSDSAAWTDSEPYTLTVGTSLLDVVRQIARSGIDFDVAYSAGSFVLSAYKNGAGTDKSNTVYFRTGVDCEEIKSDERGDGIQNALLVKYRDGFISVSDAVSIAARRRREKLLNVETAQSSSSATTIGSAEVALRKDPKKNISLKIYDGKGPRAFVDYRLGDYITLDIEGIETRYRILGIQCDYEGGTYSNIVIDLNSLLYDNDQRMARDISWLMDQWATARDSSLIEVSYWAAIGDANTDYAVGVPNESFSMCFVGRKLYVGVDQAIYSYNLDTGVWESIASTLQVRDMAALGTDIYIAGHDATIGIQPADTVGDNTWVLDTLTNTISLVGGGVGYETPPFGPPFAASARCVIVDGTDVYFGGHFDIAGVSHLNVGNVIRWDTLTSTWNAMGMSSDDYVYALLMLNGVLYAGGGFQAVDGVSPCYAIAKYSGSSWSAVGSSVLGSPFSSTTVIYALSSIGDDVVAGGLSLSGTLGNLLIFDGTTWAQLASENFGIVYGLKTYLTDLYVVGTFTSPGNRVAKFSGGTWWQLTTGLDAGTYSIALLDQDVYVFGDFENAGGKPAHQIAVYFNNFESLVDYLDVNAGSFNMGAAIHGATASAISDSDEVPFWEAVANALRKITWANIKATLKTYFDTLYVALTGNQTIAGVKTFSSDPIIPDEVYDATAWNGVLEPPTKNAVRDKIESMGGGGTPGGSDTQVQFNDGGTFGGESDFTFNKTTNALEIGGAIGSGNSRFQINDFGDSTTQPSYKGYKAAGTYASPAAVLANYILMRYGGGGYDGVTPDLRTASITITADEDFDGSSHGTRIDFFVTPNGSTSIAKAVTIEADGTVSVGGSNWYSALSALTGGIHISKDGGGAFTNVITGHSWVDGVDDFTGVPALGADRAGGSRATPTAVLDNMGLVRFNGGGYDGTALSGTRAQILLRAAGNWSGTSHPTKIELYTTPVGSVTRAVVLTVGSDGNVNIESGKTYNIAGSPHTHTHNSATSIQGGIAGEYYHLTSADNTEAVAFLNGGTGTHTAMDSHIASTANPHNTTAAQIGVISAQQDLFFGGNNATVAASTTVNTNPTSLTIFSTMANIIVPSACSIKNLSFGINSAQPASGSLVLTVQKNNVDTTLTVTIAAGSASGTVVSDTTHTISFAAGEACRIKVVNNATAASAQVGPGSLLLVF